MSFLSSPSVPAPEPVKAPEKEDTAEDVIRKRLEQQSRSRASSMLTTTAEKQTTGSSLTAMAKTLGGVN